MKNPLMAAACVVFGFGMGFAVGTFSGKKAGIDQTCQSHCETKGHDEGKYSTSMRRCACLDEAPDAEQSP